MDYLPPGHIRLLHIEAGFNDAPMRCRLETTGLEASPPYEALSYTWGSLELNSAITCNGAPMLVTHHLHEALHYLRKREHERTVWIDAVCINQEDLRERVQEATMARNSTAVCGSYSAPWDFMSRVALSVRKKAHLGPYPVQYLAPGIFPITLISLLRIAHQAPQASIWELLGLLRLTRPFKSTDPRDKVYALMGLVLDPEGIDMKADYNISTENLYLWVATESLLKRKDLALLANAGSPSTPGDLKLPSWVPDWTNNNEGRAIIAATLAPDAVNRSTTRNSQPILSISVDSKVLTIRGVQIGTIAKLETSLLFGEGVFQLDNDAVRREARWNLRCKVCLDSYVAFAEHAYTFPEGQTREESLWRTLCCDLTAEIPITRAPAAYAVGYKILRMANEATQEDGHVDTSSLHLRASSLFAGQWDQFTMFMGTLGGYCRGRNLCVTDGGYLGSVPTGSLVDDKICLLFGSRVPFVLRKCNDGYFKLVGECYIHGIMDGEAMTDAIIEASSQEFEII